MIILVPFDRGDDSAGVFQSAVFAQDGLNATCFSKMAAERDSKKILSSAEQESGNLGEYLDDSKAESEKMSKKRKSKKTSPRKY